MIEDKRVAAVVVAAGASQRMGFDKLMVKLNGVEVLRQAVHQLAAHPYVDEIVVVAAGNLQQVKALFTENPCIKPLAFAIGGTTRTHSVLAGVQACRAADLIAIHDGARPFVSQALIGRVMEAAAAMGAAAPAIPLKDTLKQAMEDALVQATVPRQHLYRVQTPQVFARTAFMRALLAVPEAEYDKLTDDCMVMERAGLPVKLVEGEAQNRKITTPDDLVLAQPQMPRLRVGHGYDVHKLAEGRRLVLGGVTVPHEKGLLGHSDADVLLHAVADALLGAAALGDLGRHFPDTDAAYKDADSQELLATVAQCVRSEGFAPVNIDATLVCQRPKLAAYVPAMRANIAKAVGLEVGAVNVKATTEEKLGFTGSGEGIAAHCVALIG